LWRYALKGENASGHPFNPRRRSAEPAGTPSDITPRTEVGTEDDQVRERSARRSESVPGSEGSGGEVEVPYLRRHTFMLLSVAHEPWQGRIGQWPGAVATGVVAKGHVVARCPQSRNETTARPLDPLDAHLQ
jgi:hypothetical protein